MRVLGCPVQVSYYDQLVPAIVCQDEDDQLCEIASLFSPFDTSCVDLKHNAFLAQLLLEKEDVESSSQQRTLIRKPLLHKQPACLAQSASGKTGVLARPAANNMPMSEHDALELRKLVYLKAGGVERQERLQYLRQTRKSSIWSEEDGELYTLPDQEVSLGVLSELHAEWDNSTLPAEIVDRQNEDEHDKSNHHAEDNFLREIKIMNLDPRLQKLLQTYEQVFGPLPSPLFCKQLLHMDLKLKPECEKARMRRHPYPTLQEQVEEIDTGMHRYWPRGGI